MAFECSWRRRQFGIIILLLWLLATLAACEGSVRSTDHDVARQRKEPGQAVEQGQLQLELPELEPANIEGHKLKVVATTSIIGDVVAQVGGDAIDLTTMIAPGQDPHSYEPSAAALMAVANADVIFVHGWDLEEGLSRNLRNITERAVVVPVAANIEPLVVEAQGHEDEEAAATEHHEQDLVDPHTWLDPHLVVQWVKNIGHVLSTLDPQRANVFLQNAEDYNTELSELIAYYDEQVAKIPQQQRKLVTDHNSLAYLAHAYDFDVIGTVIPGASTLAEPSASGLATLVRKMEQAGVCTLFTEPTVGIQLTQTVAAELATCDNVQILSLYTDAVGPEGSGAESYISMMRANVDTLVRGLNR